MIIRPKNIDCKFPFPWNFHWWHGYFCSLSLYVRYGLLDGQAYTLEEVGRKMGVTRERVRQIEAQALSRLRHPSIRRKLRDYLGE